MHARRFVFGLVFATACVALGQAATGATLAVPGRANANVTLTADGSFVVAVWSASRPSGETDIYSSVSRNGGTTFSAPVRVNATPGDGRANGEQPPRATLVARGSSAPLITVVWASRGEKGSRILTARSEDGGVTFSDTEVIPAGEAQGNRGWQNVAADASGQTRVVWLDHREMVRDTAKPPMEHNHAGHDASPESKRDGATMAQASKLYFATIGDPASPRYLTGGVCYCCKTAITTGPDGSIHLAWRHVYPGNFRDMAFAMSRDGGRTFSKPLRVSEDGWQIEGCPEDGPSIARAADGRIHIVWPTLVTGDTASGAPSIGIFHATSRDGMSFSTRARIPTEGTPHHPQLTITANGSLAVSWDEIVSGKRRAVLALGSVGADGRATFSRQILSGEEPGLYPVVAAVASGIVTAWTNTGESPTVIRVERTSLDSVPARTSRR